MDPLTGILSAFGLSSSAGLNAYIPMLILALTARFTDWFKLEPPYDTLESWWVIGALVALSIIEFFADKVPAVNHANDIVQTIIRPASGAVLFAASAQTITDVSPVVALIAGLVVAGSVHAVKAVAVRPAVTMTTGGLGNTPVSIAEDILAAVLSILAVIVPIIVGALIVLVTAFVVWWLWRRANRYRVAGL